MLKREATVKGDSFQVSAGLRKVEWLAQFWRTFFSTNASISGWCGHTGSPVVSVCGRWVGALP